MFKTAVDLPGEEFWRKIFQCCSCKEILTLKVFYCEKGHFICHRCTKCECGAKVTKLQCTFIENIVRKTRFTCELGCGTLLSNDEYTYHVDDSCRCRPVTCPWCNQLIDYKDYMHHLQRLHNIERVDLEDDACSVQITQETPRMRHTIFENQIFFIRWATDTNKLWIQSYERANGVSIEVEGIDFKYTLKPGKLHAALYEADSVNLKMFDSIRLTFSLSRNANTNSVIVTREQFRFSL